MKQLSRDFSVTAMDGGNIIIIQLQGQGGDVPILKHPLENAANVADPQHPLEITADGQVGARNIIPPNPSISESPLIPQPNAEMIMASATGGIFFIEAAK